jgi:leader peptidase (prepilin peptidase)/N-methyltransferase
VVAGLAFLSTAVSVVCVPGIAGVFGAALALLMLAIAAIDMRRFVIPDEINATAFALALGRSWLLVEPGGRATLLEAIAPPLIRGGVLVLSLLLLLTLYRRLRGREGLGLGDVKLAGVAGAWLDWTMMPVVIEIAALSALAFHFVRQLRRRRELRASARLPFGAFLAPAIWICWLLQETLV